MLGCSTANKDILPPDVQLYPPAAARWPINQSLTPDKDFKSIDLFLSRVVAEDPSQNTRWWADYRRAQLWSKKDKQVACENYSRLASEMTFPLRRLAYLRAHEVCPDNNQILARLEPFELNNFEPWLSNIALDIALKKSNTGKDKKTLLDLNLKKSKLNIRKEDKVKYTQIALQMARDLGLKTEIAELEKRLYNLAPSLNPKPSPRNYMAVANDLRFFRKFDSARKYYRKVIAHKSSTLGEKVAAYKGIRNTYRIEQNREAALEVTRELAQFVEKDYLKAKKAAAKKKRDADATFFLDTQILLARNYWTEEKRSLAEKTLDNIAKHVSNEKLLTEMYWMRGRMAEEKQDFAQAVSWYDKALASNAPKKETKISGFREKIMWYRAWNLRKMGDYKSAVKALETLIDKTENNYDKVRYRFWLARTYRDMGENGDAKDEFKDLIKDEPLTFYGLIAHHELGEPLPLKALRKNTAEEAKDLSRLPNKLRKHLDEVFLEWTIAVREEDVAREYLNEVANSVRRDKDNSVETWSSLLNLYARANQFLSLFAQLNLLDPETKKDVISEHPDLIFPRPYSETVSRAATRFGVSVEFIYSIMRQESSFNPQARSQMDAFGLMQLLPQVAKRSAEANSITYENPEDLYEPHINIPLGSAHLRELWDRYNGEIVLAVASYNASEKAIINWLQTRYRGDTLEFIEDIPYDETRDYVKLVLRNLITYQMLNSPTGPVSFPEWALRISTRDR